MQTIEELIEKLEAAREHGEYGEAFSLADQACALAVEQQQPEKLVNVLAHKLLIYKDQYTYTKDPQFLELLFACAQEGMRIVEQAALSGQPKAVMLLRMGNYYFEKGEYTTAVTYFNNALTELGSSTDGERAEYLSYLGRAQVKAGNIDEGIQTLQDALSKAKYSTGLRPFHKIVTTSGILLRLSDAYLDAGKRSAALEPFRVAMRQARELRDTYGMPVRFEQATQFGEQNNLLD